LLAGGGRGRRHVCGAVEGKVQEACCRKKCPPDGIEWRQQARVAMARLPAASGGRRRAGRIHVVRRGAPARRGGR